MRLADLIGRLESWYDPAWAEPWDRVGLVCGDPDRDVRRVLFAVDPVAAVVDEALAMGADLLLVHHPLLLTPVSTVAATTAKGRILHRLMTHHVALYTAHTNADVPADGVNEALAAALGLRGTAVLVPTDAHGLDRIVVMAPREAAEPVRRAMTAAGAGAIGDYDGCTFTSAGEGRFRPLEGSRPAIGRIGIEEVVEEVRVEAVLPRRLRSQVLAAVRAVHPYEEPALHVVELADASGDPGPAGSVRGHGRVGALDGPLTLRELAARVASCLPATAHGVRVAGDPERVVRTVAVGAGSGESLLEDVRRSGVDAYVTSDLKHHRAGEFLEDGGPALIDVAHWAAEWTWLPMVERKVAEVASAAGATVDTRVSTVVTDPWTFRA